MIGSRKGIKEVLKEAMVISYFMVLGAAVLAALLWITKWL